MHRQKIISYTLKTTIAIIRIKSSEQSFKKIYNNNEELCTKLCTLYESYYKIFIPS